MTDSDKGFGEDPPTTAVCTETFRFSPWALKGYFDLKKKMARAGNTGRGGERRGVEPPSPTHHGGGGGKRKLQKASKSPGEGGGGDAPSAMEYDTLETEGRFDRQNGNKKTMERP